jgi:hypothetical protein
MISYNVRVVFFLLIEYLTRSVNLEACLYYETDRID